MIKGDLFGNRKCISPFVVVEQNQINNQVDFSVSEREYNTIVIGSVFWKKYAMQID